MVNFGSRTSDISARCKDHQSQKPPPEPGLLRFKSGLKFPTSYFLLFGLISVPGGRLRSDLASWGTRAARAAFPNVLSYCAPEVKWWVPLTVGAGVRKPSSRQLSVLREGRM